MSLPTICQQLHQFARKLPRHRFPFADNRLPSNGIYVVFEDGESSHEGERIVRVGTHTGSDNLSKRIEEHFLTPNKDRSIFRKHVGRCLLTRDHDPFVEMWEIDMTFTKNREQYGPTLDRAKQRKVEEEVTDYIQDAFSLVAFRVDDEDERKELESFLIGTLSTCAECGPSPQWLGRHHPNRKISTSGLWNVQGVGGPGLNEDAMKRICDLATK